MHIFDFNTLILIIIITNKTDIFIYYIISLYKIIKEKMSIALINQK
jgi:hypothetical protein